MVVDDMNNSNGQSQLVSGGSGGLRHFRPVGRADTKLIEMAINKRWPIPEEMRGPLIDRQIHIATDPHISPRQATSAFNSVLAAERQNQADEHLAIQREMGQPQITVYGDEAITLEERSAACRDAIAGELARRGLPQPTGNGDAEGSSVS